MNERKGRQDGGETCDLYGLETVALRKRQEAELEVTEIKMLRSLSERQGCMAGVRVRVRVLEGF